MFYLLISILFGVLFLSKEYVVLNYEIVIITCVFIVFFTIKFKAADTVVEYFSNETQSIYSTINTALTKKIENLSQKRNKFIYSTEVLDFSKANSVSHVDLDPEAVLLTILLNSYNLIGSNLSENSTINNANKEANLDKIIADLEKELIQTNYLIK